MNIKKIILTVFICLSLSVFPENAGAKTLTIYSSADAGILSGQSQTYGTGCGTWLGRPNWTNAPNYWGLFKFEFGQIPDYATINSATLSLYNISTGGTYLPMSVSLSRITSSWTESGVKWSNKPASVSTGITGIVGPLTSKYFAFNVTSLVNGWYKYTYYNGGFYVKSNIDYYSMFLVGTRECSSDKRAKIVVEYTPYTNPPSPTPTRRPTSTPTPAPIRIFKIPTIASSRLTYEKTPTPTPTISTSMFRTSTPIPSIHIFRLLSPTPTRRASPTPTPVPTGVPASGNSTGSNPLVLNRQVEVTDTTAKITILTDKNVIAFMDYGIPPDIYVGSQVKAQYSTTTVLNIGGLLPNTRYMYGIAVVDGEQNKTYVPEGGTDYFTTKPEDNEEDSTATGGNQVGDEICRGPESGNIVISDIRIENRSDTGATFLWISQGCYQNVLDDHLASSWVYVSPNAGEDTSYDEYELNFGRADRVFSHKVIVKNLEPETLYYYKIVSKDSDGNIGISPRGIFRTLQQPVDGSTLIDPLGIDGEIPVINSEIGENAETVDERAGTTDNINNSSAAAFFNKIKSQGINLNFNNILYGVVIIAIIVGLIMLLSGKKKKTENIEQKDETKDEVKDEVKETADEKNRNAK